MTILESATVSDWRGYVRQGVSNGSGASRVIAGWPDMVLLCLGTWGGG